MPPPAEGFAGRFVLGPALRTQPDRRLVSLVRDGYETAFEEIVRRYGKPLTRYAAAIVGARGEDVTQDAFSKALQALRRDGAEIELRPWLFRIVRNTALNDLRDNPPAPEVLAEAIAGGSNPAEELERREELTDLMRRLQSLPEPQRAAIVMRELEGLSHDEIATALGLSGGAARQAIYRARQALREGLGMLLPLPLLRLLIDHGGEAAAVGTGAGGAAAASGALGGAGAGMALKAGVVTAVLAGSVGTGIALHDRDRGNAGASAATTAGATAGAATATALPVTGSDDSGSGGATGEGHGHGGPSQDGSGDAGSGRRGSDSGSAGGNDRVASRQPLAFKDNSGPDPGSSGRDHHGNPGPTDDHGESHGSGRSGPREDHGGGPHSGPGSGGGHSGGSRGEEPAGGGSGAPDGDSGRHGQTADDVDSGRLPPPPPSPEEEPREDDGSGPGPGGSDSSSGSGSSGSPERDDDELP